MAQSKNSNLGKLSKEKMLKNNENSNTNLTNSDYDNLNSFSEKLNNQKRLNHGLIAAVLVLVVVSVIAIVMAIKFGQAYVELADKNKQTFLSDVSLIVLDNESSNVSVSIFNNTLTGLSYLQNVELNTEEVNVAQVVRGKATLTKGNGESVNIKLAETENWKLGADGYLYYYGVVNKGSEVTLCKQVKLETGVLNVEDNTNMHYLTFTVESLNFEGGLASQIWAQAPENWLNSYGIGKAY